MNGVARKVINISQPWPAMFQRMFLVILREKLSAVIFFCFVVARPDRAEVFINLQESFHFYPWSCIAAAAEKCREVPNPNDVVKFLHFLIQMGRG